jgi:lipopolysaccharide transport system permease protein
VNLTARRAADIPTFIADLRLSRYVDLVTIVASRTLKTRYRGSVLGVYWSLSLPLIMTAVYSLIFGVSFSKHPYYNGSIMNYVLACFTGLVVINFFSATSSQALTSIVGSGSLLNKIRIPVSVFPISIVCANVFQLIVGALPVLLIVTLVTSHSPLNAIALFVPIVALIMIATGFSLLTSGLFVYFRDVPHLYEVVVFILWITSPIFYPPDVVPAVVRPYIALNPLVAVMDSVRQISLSGAFPDIHQMALAMLSGVIVLVVGALFFLTIKADFMDLV